MTENQFDHHAPEFNGNKYDLYREMRAKCPVAHSNAHGGFWVLSRYADVFRVARDDKTFSSEREVVVPATNVGRLLPLQTDPPELERYRSLLTPFFAPAHLQALEPFILTIIDKSIDEFIERGRADLVTELAKPVPASATMQLLGLDPSEWRTFADPLHASVYSRPGTPENTEAIQAVNAFTQKIIGEVDSRLRKPRDDMISSLLQSNYRGQSTTRQEVIDLVRMVIFGRMDTVVAALSNIFVQLGRHTDIRDRLVVDRSLLPTAIEEFLRYDAPVQGFARTVKEDTVVGNQKIKVGETVFMLWASANRDESVFGDTSDQLVVTRAPNRHTTFGIGAHRCLGAGLARTELRLVLGRVFDRLPDFNVMLDEVVEADTIGVAFGRRKVPVTFTPRQRT